MTGEAAPMIAARTENITRLDFPRREIPVSRFFFVLLSSILLARQSPAPIVEEEKPTPVPRESVLEPKPKHSGKSKPNVEQREASNKRHESTQATQINARNPKNKIRCGVVWIGLLNFGILGNADETLTIDPSGTVVVEKNQFGSATHPATWDGTTVRFQSGALNEIAFTLAPNADGQTTVVTATSLFMSNPGAAFRKTATYEGSTGVTTTTAAALQKPNEVPTAKAVPESPAPTERAKKSRPKAVESHSKSTPKASPTAAARKFTGTWSGTIQTFPPGPTATALTVDSTETSVTLTWRLATNPPARAI